jgi:hypothetical protein
MPDAQTIAHPPAHLAGGKVHRGQLDKLHPLPQFGRPPGRFVTGPPHHGDPRQLEDLAPVPPGRKDLYLVGPDGTAPPRGARR